MTSGPACGTACATTRNRVTAEYVMTLRFVGIDPNTGGEGSPTVWVGEESADLVHDIPSIIE